MTEKIAVIGSTNTDIIMKMERFPRPGETVIGSSFHTAHGGKGANQAVAAARAGAQVVFITKVGDDDYGRESRRHFEAEGINTGYVCIDTDSHSGVAVIWVDAQGENSISVASGANARLSPEEIIKRSDAISDSTILLIQLEIPVETVAAAVKIARSKGIKVILNPAPAQSLSNEILHGLYLITPNIHEAEMLTGITINDENDIRSAAETLAGKGVQNIIITCGRKGAYLLSCGSFMHVPAFDVKTVDTTAAGDIFNGVLAAKLLETDDLQEAVLYAAGAAALSVSVIGAQTSAPDSSMINSFLMTKNAGSINIIK